MKLLDLSQFEKIAEDKHTATMKHKDGHTMTILVSKLKPIHKEQLKRLKMAQGGNVESGKQTWNNQKGVHGETDETGNTGQSMAGIYQKHSKDSGETGEKSKKHALKEHSRVLGEIQSMKKNNRQYLDDGGVADNDQSAPSAAADQGQVSPDHSTTITINAAPAANQAPPPAPTQTPVSQPVVPVAPNFNPNPAPVPVSPNLGNPTNAALTQATATNLAQQAGNEQQAIDVAKAKGSVPIAQQQLQNATDIQNRQDQTIADMKKHADDFSQYMQQNPINPNHYLESQSGGKKIATSLGLILGGIAGKGSSNIALDFLNKQIDRDVQAQKDRADQQKTVFGAYNKLYDNENASTALAKASRIDQIAAQSNILAAQLGTPQAQANNKNLQSQLLNARYDNIQKAAFLANQPKGGKSSSSVQSGPQGQSSVNPESGKGGKPSYGPESADENGIYNIEPILKPNAAAIMDSYAKAATADPAKAAQLARVQQQYADSAKADQVLSQAKDIFSELKNNATPGGWVGRQVENSDISQAPIIGGALGAAGKWAGDAYTGARKALKVAPDDNEFEENRNYNTAAQKLSDLFSSVYKGIGTENLKHKLSGMLPDQTDTPENITKKMRAFEDLIKSGQEKNVLQNAGMAH